MIDVDEIHAELPAVVAYGARHPDEYAGAYVEHAPPGRVRVGFTARHEAHRAELAAELPHRRWLSVFEARHSLRELEQARRQLRADEGYLRDLGVLTGGHGVAVADNRVWVEVWRATPEQRAALAERYGSAVHLVDVTEGRRVPVEVLDVVPRDDRTLTIRYVTGGDRELSAVELSREGDGWRVQLFAEVAPWVSVLSRNRQVRETTVRLAARGDAGAPGSR